MVPPPAPAGVAYPEAIGDEYNIGVINIVSVGFVSGELHGVLYAVTGYVVAETRGANSLWQTLEVLRLSRMEAGPTTAGRDADFIMEHITLHRDWRTDATFAATARSPAGGV